MSRRQGNRPGSAFRLVPRSLTSAPQYDYRNSDLECRSDPGVIQRRIAAKMSSDSMRGKRPLIELTPVKEATDDDID